MSEHPLCITEQLTRGEHKQYQRVLLKWETSKTSLKVEPSDRETSSRDINECMNMDAF